MAYPEAPVLQYPMKLISLTSGFGYYTYNGVEVMHWAIDIVSQSDRTVYASANCEIIDRFQDALGGNTLVARSSWRPIAPGYDIITRYLHLDSFAVPLGAAVQRGESIAVQGNTGSMSTGPHLHFEMWIVPEDYTYNRATAFASRQYFAVDPLSFLHVVSGQTFIRDRYTNWFYGIPFPEPQTESVRLFNSQLVISEGVPVYYAPYTIYSPVIGGLGRSRALITDFWGYTVYDTMYRFVPAEVGVIAEWAGIRTPWGLLWAPVAEGKTELIDNGEAEPPPEYPEPDEPESPCSCEEETEALRTELTALKVSSDAMRDDLRKINDLSSRY